ncbi:hypothetical protein LX32DRAFT_367855 [Colletotrichum zoysiae]|uniref:Uncharacterized protein n=1 Tax=Colletotrichum zoysiae TaxID=1216348 RepID=A0AAD9HV80_9PEZI|nr:hypothetical protein LX32DRAFT_367855 [Colletotrichum zoysiae]
MHITSCCSKGGGQAGSRPVQSSPAQPITPSFRWPPKAVYEEAVSVLMSLRMLLEMMMMMMMVVVMMVMEHQRRAEQQAGGRRGD